MSWRRFFRRNRWDRERAAEMEFYLETETAENVERGMTPSDAAAAARRKFGNSVLIREEIYRMNSINWLDSTWQDLCYGARLLRLSPGFTTVAVLSLALGIGANTAIFELLDAVRLRSLPVRNPAELAEVRIVGGNHGLGINGPYGELTRPMWLEIRRQHPAFSGVFAWSKQQFSLGEGSTFEPVNGAVVSGEFFGVLGLEPWRGRMILPEDEHACPESTAVVSHAFWQSHMGGRELDAHTRLLINGELKHIIGVVPPAFFGLAVGERFDIYLPFCQPRELSRNFFEVEVMGRLQPGWTPSSASAQLASQSPGIMAATEITGYDPGRARTYRNFRLGAFPASSGVSSLRNEYDSSLWLLLAITGLVLLIACANLANLLLARASTREREIAVRLALGAGRVRVVRQLLAESSLLAAIGAVCGIALAQWLSRALVSSLATANDSIILNVGADAKVLLFAAGVAALTCLIFGVAPAFRASGSHPIDAMRTSGRGLTTNRERFSLQRLLVVTQIAVSLVLLVGAFLFVRSFRNLIMFDPGIRETGITVAFIGFNKANVAPERGQEFTRELLDEVRSVPGVESAATTTNVPLLGGSWGHKVDAGAVTAESRFTWVSPGYFQTMGIPLLSGRDFNRNDTAASQRVTVVNQTFVRDFLAGGNPIGRTLRTHPEPDYPATVYQIIGVIPDTRYACLRCGIPPMAFAPALQFPAPRRWAAVLVHSSQPPAAVIEAVRSRLAATHPEIVAQFRVFETMIQDGLVRERLMALLSGFFGVLAALLGTIGLYGVISYGVNRRRNEIGIRLALGANRSQVIGMVLREAALLLLTGAIIGTALALAVTRSANSLLFGLKAYDPLILASAVGLLAISGVAASFFPARRASMLDPMAALRCE